MKPVIGIDFGTSNSAVAGILNEKTQVIPDEQGRRLTPSVVAFGKDYQILVGADAKTQAFRNPKRTVHSIKRLIGRKTFSEEIEKAKTFFSFDVVEGSNEYAAVKLDDKVYSPQELAAIVIQHMKSIAEAQLDSTINEAVITVPAYFNDSQRLATKEACEMAKLKTLRVINEPTAAALAYGFGKGLKETVAIYDLGGGTFDVSILKLKDQVFEVVATAGDTFLGGDDFDDRIIDLCAESFLKRYKIDLRKIPQTIPLLRSHAEKLKHRLSYSEKSDIYIPNIVKKDGDSIDLHFSLTQDELRSKTQDLIQRTFTVCDEALNAANLKPNELDAIILVGGPTKMTILVESITGYFGQTPLNELNPDEVVAIGASIQAQSLRSQNKQGSEALLLDVTPLDLGIATVDGYIEPLIEQNSPIPTEAQKTFTTTKDDQDSVAIRIYQGKNRRVENSYLLGEFNFSGFEKKKAGEASIDVSFSINTDGIVEVTAKDPETGKNHHVSVKLSAALSDENLSHKTEETKKYKEVRLKDKWKNYTKVLACCPSAGGPTYVEGYIKDLNIEDKEFNIYLANEETKQLSKEQVSWIATVEDFANIPRYLATITKKPERIESNPPQMQLYEFTLTDGSTLYGQANLPKVREQGFWLVPYFARDELPGKIYVFSSRIKESIPISLE